MKATLVTAAAAVLVGSVSAAGHHRHAHELFHAKRGFNDSETCVPACTTIYTTITGEIIWTPTPGPLSTTSTSSFVVSNTTTSTSTSTTSTTSSSPVPTSTSTTPAVVPTPIAQTCPTPGTYTFPATTLTLTETTTVCGASTTTVPSGTHTLGGVTTVVETATTVVCPYATVSTSGTVVTSVIETTTYVCPSAGTYTIGAITTTVTATETVVPVPVVTSYAPGTYTAPAIVTTITETDYVVYCPFTSPAPATTEVATTAAASPAASTSTSAAAKATSSSTSVIGTSGDQWAVTYTPYTSDTGACKTADEVLSDIEKIASAGFTAVRVYSTDCSTLPNVGSACEAHGLKMIIGIFIGEVGCDNGSPDVATQISAIEEWAKWDLVELVIVGNEALFNNYCTASELASLITHVKSVFGGAGYSGLYTTTDVVSAWLGEGISGTISEVCDAIDIVSANAHAFFNADTLPGIAGAFVEGQLKIVEGICGKPGCIAETGWPNKGNANGVAVPGTEQQSEAISSIRKSLGGKAVLFSWSSDAWKTPGPYDCEQYFGIESLFG
ncbi:Glycoside hydrolase family 17 protein [Pleurostoma richardsiae]|uniref:Probable beta-glucosidase btgE n=1 Tax=Pleurostoma richardsiae TaxID=41990 RepID=A0AA38RSD9_9PEZI|nr:Glycoside hydrolase family 17 protein [Pleurostoma richardsiae]